MTHDGDLTGKSIVITGATSGIGLATAGVLAARGAYVVGVGRSAARCQGAEQQVREACPDAELTFCIADLASQRQVRGLAADVSSRLAAAGLRHLDVLVNNAGTVSSKYVETDDGHELQFAVNHLAPFLLTHELTPRLRQAAAARVIVVSSNVHRRARIHWKDVMLRRRYGILKAYR